MKSPLDKFGTEEVWNTLVAIKGLELESPDEDDHTRYALMLSDNWEDAENRRDILNELSGLGVIRVISYSSAPWAEARFEINSNRLSFICADYKERIRSIRNKNDDATPQSDSSEKAIVVIDSKYGIFIQDNHAKAYDIRGVRRDFLFYLVEQNGMGLSAQDLIPRFWKNTSMITKEINGINSAFKNILGFQSNLVINSGTGGGYLLNENDYRLEIRADAP